ncbi:MAG: UDP-4-amino-4,6-dideoxy-N-acetyl-beta-L-altrosamine N-acetyltransferase [Clostridium sp.]|jgi:UDP-4-amino-4,6-dideoxy-N-acetyl-beta-L-altrosamine N-acetyltransferase|nr:UDP-4-amino-4,6-dideoxy-N-acetyl-beta-L-altrosamine N-acetyltransferase [Clostridium sp.]
MEALIIFDESITDLIYLRPVTWEDMPLLIAWRNSADVRRYFIYQEPFTLEGQAQWMKAKLETGLAVQMLVCMRENDQPVGCVYLSDIDHKHHKAEYGIYLGEPSVRGKGIGTLAAKLLLQYGFEQLALHKIYLRVLADNEAAIRSYEKAGFVQEGYLKEEVFVDGLYRDLIWMAILRESPDDALR